MITIRGKYNEAIVYHNTADESSTSQIMQMMNSPVLTNPVRIMPDFHAGKGSVVGFTMPVGEYVIPNIVGVDIGCGMLSFRVQDSHFDIGLRDPKGVDYLIRKSVPLGFNIRDKSAVTLSKDVEDLAKKIGMDNARLDKSVGTLGGGNHFIEIGVTDRDEYWFTIHTGSRNFGLQVANFHQTKAREFSKDLPDVDKDLEYISSGEYLNDMIIAQGYASLNRKIIMESIETALGLDIQGQLECAHNYISQKDNIIRKGAVSAHEGDDIILPFNRAEGIWIMKGKGNPEWNFSAPHGAGRRMSRGQAKREMTQEYVDEEMKSTGVYSSFNPIDEAPDAYKNPEEIKELIKDTAEFQFAIKPILNIKG